MREFDPEVSAKTGSGLKKFRALCESALVSAGLHVSEGSRLWAIYRGFEMALEEGGAGGCAGRRMPVIGCVYTPPQMLTAWITSTGSTKTVDMIVEALVRSEVVDSSQEAGDSGSESAAFWLVSIFLLLINTPTMVSEAVAIRSVDPVEEIRAVSIHVCT